MHFAKRCLDLIGNTPLLQLKNFGENVYAKAEFLNPGGSIKDRPAKYMIEQAILHGKLTPGMKILEATSGNTGIGLCLVGKQLGYDAVIAMPDGMSEERKKLMVAFGGELILTPQEEGIHGSVEMVERLFEENPDLYYRPDQFSNPDNELIHFLTTGPEIFEQMGAKKVDIFLNGIGSGGTIAGVGRFLKEVNPDLHVVAVEPLGASAVLGHEPGMHRLDGIGDGFIPELVDPAFIDEVVEVSDDDAVAVARELAKAEGCIVGTSAGAHVWAAMRLARANPQKTIVTTLPDRGERYFSSALI